MQDVLFKDLFIGTNGDRPHSGKWVYFLARTDPTTAFTDKLAEINSNKLHIKVTPAVAGSGSVNALSRAEFKPPFTLIMKVRPHLLGLDFELNSSDFRDGAVTDTGLYGKWWTSFAFAGDGSFNSTVIKDGVSDSDSSGILWGVDTDYYVKMVVTELDAYFQLVVTVYDDAWVELWTNTQSFDKCKTKFLRPRIFGFCGFGDTIEFYVSEIRVYGTRSQKVNARALIRAGTGYSASFSPTTTDASTAGAVLPTNTVWIWTGTLANIPAGLALCDGAGGRYDLLGHFLKGAEAGSDGGASGGSTTHDHTGTSGSDGGHDHGGTSGSDGAHQHTTASTTGAHAHSSFSSTSKGGTGITVLNRATSAGDHDHTWVNEGAHTHGIDSQGAHTHTISSGSSLPAYYEVAYVQSDGTLKQIPAGLKCYWGGTVATIPTDFAKCDGTGGLPSLNGKFLRQVPDAITDPSTTGGADSHIHTTGSSGAHTHTLASGVAHSHTSNAGGVHNHGTVAAGSGGSNVMDDPNAGSHTHGTDSQGDHSHTTNSTGAHTHTVNSGSTLPEYVELIPISATKATNLVEGLVCIYPSTVASIPTGFVLCDGTLGTQDTRGKYIRCTTGNAGGTGGAATHTHTLVANADHTHTIDSQGAHTHTSANNGAGWTGHSHGTVGVAAGASTYAATTATSGSNHTHGALSNTGAHSSHTTTAGGAHNSHSIANTDNDPTYYEVLYIMAHNISANTIDGSTSTYWSPVPVNEAGAWVKWDLGASYAVGKFEIYWGADADYNPTDYLIERSTDDINWTSWFDETTAPTAGAWTTYTDNRNHPTLRYIRLTVHTHGASGLKVYEMRAYSGYEWFYNASADIVSYSVKKRDGAVSSASLILANRGNRYSDVKVTSEVLIYGGYENMLYWFFGGFVNHFKKSYPPSLLTLDLLGYQRRLGYLEAHGEVYAADATSVVVADLIDTYFTGIFTYDNVDTGVNVDTTFDDVIVADCLEKLKTLNSGVYFVDDNRDIHLKALTSEQTTSNITLTEEDLERSDYDETDEIVNDYTVDGSGAFTGTSEDTVSQSTYYHRERTKSDDTLGSNASCEDKAEGLLAVHKDPTVEFALQLKPFLELTLYDVVTVTITEQGISGSYVIKEVNQSFSSSGLRTSVTFSQKVFSLSDVLIIAAGI